MRTGASVAKSCSTETKASRLTLEYELVHTQFADLKSVRHAAKALGLILKFY
jgi:hypothetical protein